MIVSSSARSALQKCSSLRRIAMPVGEKLCPHRPSVNLRLSAVSERIAGRRFCRHNMSTASDHPMNRLSFSVASLGLERGFISPVLATIKQLPEVEIAWNEFPSRATIDNLKRAADVFASFDKGGKEHIAVCAMLAECQQRLAFYDESLLSLDQLGILCQSTSIPNATEDMLLAKAKVLWTKGEFLQAQELCESIISEYNDLQEVFPTTSLHMASAMSGKALSQLAAMKTMDDAYSVRDYFRIAIKFLERHPPSANSLPQAAVHANCGVAEAVYAMFLREMNDVSVPMDSALRTWFQGLQKTESDRSETTELLGAHYLIAASKMLQSNIQANLAWGVLNYEKDRSDRLSKASEYAGKALKVHDDADIHNNLGAEGMCRVLSIVASCYHEAGSAVTAEGLFQSAVDKKKILPAGPLSQLELRDACLWYAKLCRKWEKREGDAKRLEQEAAKIDDSLPVAWKGKSGIHGSLWFWTPGDFI